MRPLLAAVEAEATPAPLLMLGVIVVAVMDVKVMKAAGPPPLLAAKAAGPPPLLAAKAAGPPPLLAAKAAGPPPLLAVKAAGAPPLLAVKAAGAPPPPGSSTTPDEAGPWTTPGDSNSSGPSGGDGSSSGPSGGDGSSSGPSGGDGSSSGPSGGDGTSSGPSGGDGSSSGPTRGDGSSSGPSGGDGSSSGPSGGDDSSSGPSVGEFGRGAPGHGGGSGSSTSPLVPCTLCEEKGSPRRCGATGSPRQCGATGSNRQPQAMRSHRQPQAIQAWHPWAVRGWHPWAVVETEAALDALLQVGVVKAVVMVVKVVEVVSPTGILPLLVGLEVEVAPAPLLVIVGVVKEVTKLPTDAATVLHTHAAEEGFPAILLLWLWFHLFFLRWGVVVVGRHVPDLANFKTPLLSLVLGGADGHGVPKLPTTRAPLVHHVARADVPW
ncbi:UNVERIFIED_CONTAM: hypothetical protein FKN15_011711 [Acipenser sinensis]